MGSAHAINELKVVDVQVFTFSSSPTVGLPAFTAGSNGIQLLNGTKNGAAFYHRIGSRIRMKSIEIKMAFYANNIAAGTDNERLRVAIVYDAQVNTQTPAFSNIFQCRDNGGVAATNDWSMINMDQRDRYLILKEWYWSSFGGPTGATSITTTPSSVASAMTARVPKILKWYIKLKGLETIYGGTSVGDVSDINSGALFICCVSTSGAAACSFSVNGWARLRFYD